MADHSIWEYSHHISTDPLGIVRGHPEVADNQYLVNPVHEEKTNCRNEIKDRHSTGVGHRDIDGGE